MKITRSIIGILLFQTLSLFGDVKFEFIYTDKPGTGFHIRPEAKAAVEDVGRLIGSQWLKQHNATIVMKVFSEENAKSNALASIRPVDYLNKLENGFHHSYLGEKIIAGQKNEDKDYDAILNVNFAHPFSFSDKVKLAQIDLKDVLIHEMTHALGFASSSSKCPESEKELLDNNLSNFVNQLFVYGIKSIEGHAHKHTFSKLVKTLKLLESTRLKIDADILDKANSPIEMLQMGLVLEFKKALKDGSPFERSKLFNQFSKQLTQKGLTVQEFIKHSNDAQLWADFLLGFKKLSENASDPLEEKNLLETVVKLDLIHDGFNDYITDQINKTVKTYPQVESIYRRIQEIFVFYNKYLISGKFSKKELEKINNATIQTLGVYGLSIEELAKMFSAAEGQSERGYTYFDQFVTKKDGKQFFDGKVDHKIVKACLLKDGRSGKQLYFNGPNALKYTGYPIPLNGMDGSHILPGINSIMNPAQSLGLQSREWDAYTTAIMLDLGYNVENHWTRLWKNEKGKAKKPKKDKEKARKAKAKKEDAKAHRPDIKKRH